jgi:molybdate transport repressor ModE-like protein
MPRKAYLANYLNSDELKQKYRQSREPVESRRCHLLWKISLGWSIKKAAIAVGISYRYAKEVLKKYNEEGEKALINKKLKLEKGKRGRKALLNSEELKKLKQRLESRPDDGGLWTGPKVANWIAKEKGRKKVSNQRGWDYLKKLKYSWQSPRPKHRKGCQEEQEKFKENLPLEFKKYQEKHPNAEIELWFFDEHRVGLKPILRKEWCPIGERASAIVSHRYEWLYVYGFVQPKTGDTLWYLIPRVNILWLNIVYQQFVKDVQISEKKKYC